MYNTTDDPLTINLVNNARAPHLGSEEWYQSTLCLIARENQPISKVCMFS